MKRFFIILAAFLITVAATAQDLITDYPVAGAFPIVSRRWGITAIYADTSDHWLVRKAARLLQDDIQRTTGYRPALLTTLSLPGFIQNLIIIGSLDHSPLIRQLAQQNRIPVNKLSGKWETYSINSLDKPVTNVGRALIIAGSDRRGTAYGVFELSKQMGVSPWYWWADVPVAQKKELYCRNRIFTVAPPAVKYRGFFINDEAPALSGWAKAKFGGLNHVFYEKVFELLLRLRANYLWPAMWGNAFNDDDPLNPQLASLYGIVMGTSHHEPMLRAQQEWKRYGSGPWNYQTNAAVLDSFWQKGIENMDHHESIVTVGMRGDGDMPMEESSNIALLEKIVRDQREIIRKVTGKDPSETPQSWALYKEVQDYYDKGMRVPDDVTLLLCDDNWGNVRKLPMEEGRKRSGGYGLYYHFDYVGDPRNYKWVNTNPIARVWEQLHLTKEYGDDRIWIVNVGDIKPMEFPIEFFMDYAWDPSAWPADKLPDYTLAWATRQFGPQYAAPIAQILTRYTLYNGRRKPELLSPDTYSLLHYQEADRIVHEYNTLARRADSLYQQLPSALKDAYYQLVLYPVAACANLNELYVTVAKNHLYATQGRALTNALASRAQQLFEKDSLLSLYYNKDLSYGKWVHMMDQTHIGYTYWQQPPVNALPALSALDLTAQSGPSWGLTPEGSAAWWPGSPDAGEASLPAYYPWSPENHFLTLFARSNSSFDYTITTDAPWLQISQPKGTVRDEEQIWIGINWQKAPAGHTEAYLTVTGPDNKPIRIKVTANNPHLTASATNAFIEANGYVSIEAEHYTRSIETSTIKWQVIPDLGRTLSGLEALPVTAAPQSPAPGSPHLEYEVMLFDTGTVQVQAYFSPTLDFSGKGLRYGISFDDEAPQILDLTSNDKTPGAWGKMVADNIRIMASSHHLLQPGRHTLKYWLVDPGVVLQKIVVDAGGVKPSYLGPPESYRVIH